MKTHHPISFPLFTLAALIPLWMQCPAQAVTDGSPQAPLNLEAPPLARTASTALLTWDKPAAAGVVSYEVLRNGVPMGETKRLSFTATNLAPGGRHRFTVRSRLASGGVAGESVPIVVETKSPGRVFNVREFGARGDGIAQDTAAIQQAITACPPAGTVLIPPGDYLSGPIELKSNLTLELAAGATLRFLGHGAARYPVRKVTLPGPDGEVTRECSALITAHQVARLTITGAGVIHGNGETWWPHAKDKSVRRPFLLQFIECADVFVQGITLDDPPAWNTHPLYVDRAVFASLTFRKMSTVPGINGDGLDPDSCRDVLIVGCTFANQDDSIAIKAGRVSREQPRRQRPCENITVRDCTFDGTLAPGAHPLGFAVGSETSGTVRHVLVRDCVFRDAASLANLKANRERAKAVVEGIRIENCTYANRVFRDKRYNRAPIAIDLFYYSDGPPDAVEPLTPATPVFRDIHFRNLSVENPLGRFAYLCGLAEQPVRGITLQNVTGTARQGLHGQNLDGIELCNVSVNAHEGPPFHWVNVKNQTTKPPSPSP